MNDEWILITPEVEQQLSLPEGFLSDDLVCDIEETDQFTPHQWKRATYYECSFASWYIHIDVFRKYHSLLKLVWEGGETSCIITTQYGNRTTISFIDADDMDVAIVVDGNPFKIDYKLHTVTSIVVYSPLRDRNS